VSAADASRIARCWSNASQTGAAKIRGQRHTMLDDTDINAQRHIRGAVAGLVAGAIAIAASSCPAVRAQARTAAA